MHAFWRKETSAVCLPGVGSEPPACPAAKKAWLLACVVTRWQALEAGMRPNIFLKKNRPRALSNTRHKMSRVGLVYKWLNFEMTLLPNLIL
jgi:hypothetical protein